jgi:NAD(P)-dependent dehydrogenase (short-subunit alcohol dehydrogenase family)
LSVYAATKAAVVSLTMSVQVESPRNVRVHALCPDGVATAMVDAMKDDGRAKALVHSGGRLLSAEETAEAAVGLVGTTRVVRSLPGWRAGLMRFTSLTPSVSMRAEKLFLWEGRRRMRKQV